MKVIKTTFEEEQRQKEEAWLKMEPIERMDHARRIRERMKKPGVNYSFKSMPVKVNRQP